MIIDFLKQSTKTYVNNGKLERNRLWNDYEVYYYKSFKNQEIESKDYVIAVAKQYYKDIIGVKKHKPTFYERNISLFEGDESGEYETGKPA